MQFNCRRILNLIIVGSFNIRKYVSEYLKIPIPGIRNLLNSFYGPGWKKVLKCF